MTRDFMARPIVAVPGASMASSVARATLPAAPIVPPGDGVATLSKPLTRARTISAGSLAAGKLGKALAAQQVAIADVEDLWSLTLSKEEAAARPARVRGAKQRDEQRAKRNKERANSADRISREDMAKARDGRVGAQVRFVIAGEDKGRRNKDGSPRKTKTTANDLLDRLGY